MNRIPPNSVPDRPRSLSRCVQATIGLGSILVIFLAVGWAAEDSRSPAERVGASASLAEGGQPSGRSSYDLALYEAEVRRMRGGESYYVAAAAELPARGYPTKSVFNWRQPLPMALIAALPRPDHARVLLGILGAIILLLGYGAVRSTPELSPAAWAWVVLTALSLLPGIMPKLYYSSELWAGNLILLSLLLASTGRTLPAVFAGTAALFFREPALPYCLAAAAAAWMLGRRREFAAWSAGLFVWGAFFAWHAAQVTAHTPPDAAACRGWLCGGGIDFVLSTAQMHFILVLLPRWAAVVYFALAAVGFVGCKSELGRRAAAAFAAYVAFFAVVGQPFNQYWGQLWAPLLCLGVTRSLALGLRFGGGMLPIARRFPPFSRRLSGAKGSA
ncbi:MAG: hypothetical protein GYA33_03655 [Thermogutta sp.]|nr:hypothetical protein [Thermogutta sp.]